MKKKIDDALLNFYMEADESIIKSSIVEEISNLDEYNSKKLQLINKINFLAKAVANKQKSDYLLKLVTLFQDAIDNNIEKPIAMLKQLIQAKDSLVLNNNLSRLTKEEIIEIIKDKNFVELLEQLEKDNDKSTN